MADTKVSALTAASDLVSAVLVGETSGVNKSYPIALFDTRYQAASANLTSWAAITRASGFDTFVATPSSANFASLITDETGTGKVVLATGPTISAPLFSGSTSGTTTLQATATASGVLTLPAATDTLIGKATTDTLTNKTYDTAGTGNSFSINGLAATSNTGTGAVVRATSPTLTTPTLGDATATSITSSLNPATGPVLNVAGNTQSVASGAEIVLSSNSGLLVLNENTSTGVVGVFVAGGGVVTKIGGDPSYIVGSAPTTSQIGVYFDGGTSRYRVKNGFATAKSLIILWIATRNTV